MSTTSNTDELDEILNEFTTDNVTDKEVNLAHLKHELLKYFDQAMQKREREHLQLLAAIAYDNGGRFKVRRSALTGAPRVKFSIDVYTEEDGGVVYSLSALAKKEDV